MRSAQGATTGVQSNRENTSVTRHQPNHTRAAAAPLRPTAQLVPGAVNRKPMRFFDHHRSTRNRNAARRSRSKATRQTVHRAARTIPTRGQKSNHP